MSAVAKVFSAAPIGYEGSIIEVESDIAKGLPALQIVGLGNKAIDEAKERVRSAVRNSLLEFPASKITINLAPAELPKDGTHYDVPIALAILCSAGQLRQAELAGAVFAGELALDGQLRPVSGIIAIVEAAKQAGYASVYVPIENTEQALLVSDITVFGVKNLKELYLHLKKESPLSPATSLVSEQAPSNIGPFIDDIIGQEQAKRAAIIATAGRHNILLNGPPGAGKTMLAKSMLSLLPELSKEERLAITKLYSLAGEAIDHTIQQRPFRAPHHTSSRISLVGGGTRPKPGEVSLAHKGVLFLDELPEYARATLEALRQPLEDKTVAVVRANGRATYPADFMLVATMNPCPCGFYGDQTKACSCSITHLLSYQKKLSGPLLDRIDMSLTMTRVPNDSLLATDTATDKPQHTDARKAIDAVTDIQQKRYGSNMKYNGNLSSAEIKKYANPDPDAVALLTRAADKMSLSARSYFKILRVARTIADLSGSETISVAHMSEALQYRQNS